MLLLDPVTAVKQSSRVGGLSKKDSTSRGCTVKAQPKNGDNPNDGNSVEGRVKKTYRAQTNLKREIGSPAALVLLSSPEECDCVGGEKHSSLQVSTTSQSMSDIR